VATRKNRSHAVSIASVAAVGTAYAVAKLITLTGQTTATLARDKRAIPLPAVGCNLDHLEIVVTTLAGGATKIQPCLYHDATCDRPFWEGAATAPVAGLTTAAELSAAWSVNLDWDEIAGATYTSPSGKLYLCCKTDAGTATISIARIFFEQEN
jgi:hypothetical protein